MNNAEKPAYPYIPKEGITHTEHPELNNGMEGLTKREMIAAMAMQGILTLSQEGGRFSVNGPWLDAEVIAEESVRCADALLKVLERPVEQPSQEVLEALMELVNQVQVRHVEDVNDPLWVAAKKGLAIINKATK